MKALYYLIVILGKQEFLDKNIEYIVGRLVQLNMRPKCYSK